MHLGKNIIRRKNSTLTQDVSVRPLRQNGTDREKMRVEAVEGWTRVAASPQVLVTEASHAPGEEETETP